MLHKATVRNVNRALKEVNYFWWEGEFKPLAKKALKEMLDERMEDEMTEYIGLQTYERGDNRSDYRNGSYRRTGIYVRSLRDRRFALTSAPDEEGFHPSVLDAYKRRHRNIDEVIRACFVLGLSTRKAAAVLALMLGETISAPF